MDNKEFLNDFYYKKLKFCGCGCPSDTLFIVRNMLNVVKIRGDRWRDSKCKLTNQEVYEEYKKGIKEALNLKEEDDSVIYSINEGIIESFYNVLTNVDVLEHGSSIGGSWLTDYGKELLVHLNSLSDDDLKDILD
jgi:hypothetical protein